METNNDRLQAKAEINLEMTKANMKRLRLNTIFRVITRDHRGAENVATYAQVAREAEEDLNISYLEMRVTPSHVKECIRLLNSQKNFSGMNTSDKGVYFDKSMESQLENIIEKCDRVLSMKRNVSSLLSNFIRDFGAEHVPIKIYDFIDQFGGLSIESEEDEEYV